jgi:peptide/nickel transport system permease protein
MSLDRAQVPPATRLTPVTAESALLQRPPQSYWSMALRSLRQDKLTLAALSLLLMLGLLALLAPIISQTLVGVGPNDTNPNNALAQPYLGPYLKWHLGLDVKTAPRMLRESGGVSHWLGTDQLGRDQLVRLLYGGRVSLTIAFVAAFIAVILGVTIGAIAGYFGGRVDDVFMWTINTLASIPDIYLLIIVSAIFKPNPTTLILFLGLLGWFGTARLIRGNVFKVRELDYVLAARSLGAATTWIMAQHVIPNSIPILVVSLALDIGNLILVESILSFLGLGVQPPTATWGSMLNRAQGLLFLRDPATGTPLALHLIIAPGALITLTVLTLYLIGDGLRDALDPTMKNTR